MSTFIENKYTKWYFNLIKNAQALNRAKGQDTYFESHHIMPRSLSGSDDPSNLVLLTPKEHFVCHKLLLKMVSNESHLRSMVKAYTRFFKGRYITSSRYDSEKKQLRNFYSALFTGSGNPNFNGGGNYTKESRSKISTKRQSEKGLYCWVTKDDKDTKILKTELQVHIQNGWVTGRGKTFTETIKAVANTHNRRKGNTNHMFGRSVFDCWVEKHGQDEAERRLEQRRAKTRGFVYLNNGQRNNFTPPNEVDDFLKNGWIKGKLTFKKVN